MNPAPAKRILIIGGTALLGPHVIRELSPNTEIHTLTRTGKRLLFETAHKGDRRNRDDLNRAIDAAQPDLILDMIPFTKQDADIFCELAPAHFPVVALSSCDVYQAHGLLHGTEHGPPQPCPLRETAALRTELGPEGLDYDKIAVESSLAGHFTNLTILRMPALYGWPDTTRVLPYLNQMLDGAPEIKLTAHRARFKFCRALHKNAAHAVSLAVQAMQTGQHIYNVAEQRAYTEIEWAERIAAHVGWSGKIVITPDNEHPDRQHMYVDSSKIRSELGFSERHDPDEGLADTVAFHIYQRHGKPYKKYY
jgi:nucleoside-diphosphate-sugar epimerase